MGNDYLAVGSVIREARKRKKISAGDLGEMLDPAVSHTAVYKWEKDLTEPSIGHLRQLGEILEIDLAEILGFSQESPHDEMCRYFDQMNEKQRNAVLGVARAMVDC